VCLGTTKYETADFAMIVCSDGSKQKFIADLFGKMKDPSKQFTIKFQNIPESKILDNYREYPLFFAGVTNFV
jgi:hypothetical protein